MKKLIIATLAALMLPLTACDSYLDINDDPNSPTESNITSSMLFPAIEMNLASAYGNFSRICGGYFAEHYAHQFGTSNYVDYSQFTMSATRSSTMYSLYFQGALSNNETVLSKSLDAEEYGTYLAATVIRAFIFTAMVDCYGEVPYTEALDEDIVSPNYDDGLTIYRGVIDELDNALALANASDIVCTNFLYPSGTAAEWIQFANALKLKLLMRMADVESVQSELAELVEEDNFPTEDVAFTDCWSDESGSMNPYYAEEFSTSWGSTQINVVANVAIVNSMQIIDSEGNIEYTDPRLAAFFEPNTDDGEWHGGVSGTNHTNASGTGYFCRPVASYDMPLVLISVAEVEFFLSEYYARYGSSTDAEEHYAAAIEASFASAGVDGAEANIERYPFDASNYKKSIGEAKWIALAGVNSYEAWCEMRRLRYPEFSGDTGNDYYDINSGTFSDAGVYEPFTLYTPIDVFSQVGSDNLLERWPYAEYSSARNSNTPTFPGYTTPVFWAE